MYHMVPRKARGVYNGHTWPERKGCTAMETSDATETTAARCAETAVYTPDELLQRMRISRSGLQNLFEAGRVPGAFRIGTLWRIKAEAFDAWWAQQGAPAH